MTEFLPLIIEHDGEALTTSRAVAESFGKRHDNIIHAIEQILADGLELENEPSHLKIKAANPENNSGDGRNFALNASAQNTASEFLKANFIEAEYIDAQGKPRKQYIITKDGFALLAMGFTGAKALQFKIAYINAFNRMERLIHGAPLTGLTSAGEPQRALTAPQGDLFSREAGVFMEALVMALASGERVLVPRDMPIGEEPPNTIGEYTDVLVRVNFVEALELYRERSAAPVSRTAIKTALIDTGRAALLRSKKNVLTIRGRRVCALEFVRAQSPALNDVINHR